MPEAYSGRKIWQLMDSGVRRELRAEDTVLIVISLQVAVEMDQISWWGGPGLREEKQEKQKAWAECREVTFTRGTHKGV